MKDKLLLGTALCCIALAVYVSSGRKSPGPDERGEHSASADRPLFRSSNREAGEQAVHTRRARLDIMAGDREELVKALNAAVSSQDDGELARLISEHAGGDYLKVMNTIRDDGGFGSSKEQILSAFVRCWATNDPGSAIRWARQLPEWQRDATFARICLDAASREPALAMNAVLEAMDGKSSEELAENIAESWATQDLSGLVGWARAMPEGCLRDRIFARAVAAQADKDPERAVDLMLAEIPAGEVQEQAIISIVHQWALRDPSGVSRWVAAFPSSELRNKARAELAVVSRYKEALRGDAVANPVK